MAPTDFITLFTSLSIYIDAQQLFFNDFFSRSRGRYCTNNKINKKNSKPHHRCLVQLQNGPHNLWRKAVFFFTWGSVDWHFFPLFPPFWGIPYSFPNEFPRNNTLGIGLSSGNMWGSILLPSLRAMVLELFLISLRSGCVGKLDMVPEENTHYRACLVEWFSVSCQLIHLFCFM